MGKNIVTFCPEGGGNACPTVKHLKKNGKNKQIVITDDFGKKIEMSVEQWNGFVQKAQTQNLLVK